MRKILVLLACLVAMPAFAGTATVTWTNPTSYADGSALPATDITSTTVEYGTCAGLAFGTKSGQVVATGSVATAVVNNLAPGVWCFRAATLAKGVASTFSNVAQKTVVQSAPNPPTLLDAIISWLRNLFNRHSHNA